MVSSRQLPLDEPKHPIVDIFSLLRNENSKIERHYRLHRYSCKEIKMHIILFGLVTK